MNGREEQSLRGRTTLVVGGTGAMGRWVVERLLEEGSTVTILHTGRHEVEFSRDVEHLHGDPHFAESLEQTLDGREFDVTFSLYGRLRHVAAVMTDRTSQFLAASGAFYAGWTRAARESPDEACYTELHVPVSESSALEPSTSNGIVRKGVESERLVLELGRTDAFAASTFRLPRIYGQGSVRALEWSIVKRLLDGRRRIVVPDGGLALQTQVFSRNAAEMFIAAAKCPAGASGHAFNVADDSPVTARQWISTVAQAVGAHEPELVSVPFDLAFPGWAYARGPWVAGHRVMDISKAKDRLGYVQPFDFTEAIEQTVAWCLDNPIEEGSELLSHLDDPFDYEAEDLLLDVVDRFRLEASGISRVASSLRHPYAHPVAPANG